MYISSHSTYMQLTLLLMALLLGHPPSSQAEFIPPRIIQVVRSFNSGSLPDPRMDKCSFIMSKGTEANIKVGDTLNVYREKKVSAAWEPGHIFIGIMIIVESQEEISVGNFSLNPTIRKKPSAKYKTALKGDIVAPRLVLDTKVLFEVQRADLKPAAKQAIQEVSEYLSMFTPDKVLVEGHTDTDGDADFNQDLSERRAEAVRRLLVNSYNFDRPELVESRGFGEDRPIADNSTPEGKARNRRVEIIIFD